MYDPTVPQDRAHAERLLAAKAVDLRWPFLSHKVPPALKRMNILKPMALEMLDGTMTRKRFTELMRARRMAIPYTIRMIESAIARGHHDLAQAGLTRARQMGDNWKLRQLNRNLRKTIAQNRKAPE